MASIKDGIYGSALANKIRLERAVHKGSFLLVEGNSDANLFERFRDPQTCSITICMGKENLLDAVTELKDSGFCGVLGFADQDFAKFLGFPTFNGEIVFTDENDMEIMILCSEALDKVLQEFGSEDKILKTEETEGMSVKDLIFKSASIIGTLRLLSQREKWFLQFEKMKYKFVANNSYLLNELPTVKHILGRSEFKVSMTEDEILKFIRCNCIRQDIPKKNLCCGHDCVRILGKALKSTLGNSKGFNNDDGAATLEKILRLAYEFEHFKKTNAYNGIRNWEKISGFKILQ